MSAFNLTKVSAAQTRGAYGQVKKRWLHGSLKRQAIMMPAMSPMMTEGTITRWKKKEGDAFVAGDILLQIESEFYMVDVEAHAPGVLGKILMPDGSTNVPVEQVIALVAQDPSELSILENQSPLHIPPPFNPLPIPPSTSINPMSNASNSSGLSSPRPLDQFRLPPLLSPRTSTCTMSPRTPSLFEMHTMGYGQRSMHVGGPKGRILPRLDALTGQSTAQRGPEFPPCPSPRIQSGVLQQTPMTPIPATPMTAHWPISAGVQKSSSHLVDKEDVAQVDGAAIRRMIVSNLSSGSIYRNLDLDELL